MVSEKRAKIQAHITKLGLNNNQEKKKKRKSALQSLPPDGPRRRNPVRSSQTKTNYKFHDVEESKYQEKEDDDDEGSSEGGVPCAALSDDHFDPAINDDISKQTIFEEGSRVLVNYKGILFMATIRRHCEKSGKSEYLVHYDGNNKKLSNGYQWMISRRRSGQRKKFSQLIKMELQMRRTNRSLLEI